MPRMEPLRLLNCLSLLLSPIGGIKSRDVIYTLVELMRKYSKKLVSKCIYIQILKCTDIELLTLFMGCGGWRLVHMWLTESIVAKNWPLVRELLELLLLCPVDIERLKTNNNPKLIKELSKDGNNFDIRVLASKLVEQWLKIVKGEQITPISITDIPEIISNAQQEVSKTEILETEVKSEIIQDDDTVIDKNVENIKPPKEEIPSEPPDNSENHLQVKDEIPEREKEAIPILKLSLKNGRQIISQVHPDNSQKEDSPVKEKSKEKTKSKDKDKSDRRSSSSSSSSRSKHSSKSSSSLSHDKHKHKSSRHSDSKEKSRDKERDRDKSRHSSDSSKSKHSSSSSSKKSSSTSSRSKDDKSSKQSSDKVKEEKDKIKEENLKSEKTVPSIHKLGKIPKLSEVKKDKPSISIEVRKPDEPKPKTVKMFNSKFRTHGLEEEIKPPPSRATILSNKKPPPALPPTVSIPKRSSPLHNETPPEKKAKTLDISKIEDKPGAIKLIPPKPKPMVLQESDMFMDALNASATNKKEPKKRKRRTSGSKDGNANDGSPPHTPTITSPSSEGKSVPPKFYQDTLDNEDKAKEKTSEDTESSTVTSSDSKMETDEPHTLTVDGLKGVLCYHKRKGPKKSIKWKPDSELEEVQFFELDETERVNVTKTFTDMKYLDRIHEREAYEKARNLINDDVMEEKTSWKPLVLINAEGQTPVEYGKNSKEKDIQALREKVTLQPLYFYKSMIPDSPLEPDPETHTYSEPSIIPLEDVTGNQDNVGDFRNMPWPEPKGNAPPNTASNNTNVAPLFPTNIPQFPNGFPGPQFPGMPSFAGPPMMPGEWPNGVPPMMPNGMPGQMPTPGMPPGPMPPGNLPPGMMVPPDNMMMGPEMFGGPNPMFPVGPDGFNIQQNMFPVDFNMGGPQGPPGPDGFNGPNNFRGAMRGRGSGGWRGKAATGNWDMAQRGRGGGRGGGRKTVCIYFQRKGSCRQGDNCTFLHPGVNCPF